MANPSQAGKAADHHYVPKFYLKGFTDKQGSLWVYEKGTNAPRESTPKKEGHRENYYTFTDRGFPDDSTEKMLSKVESMVAPVMKKLANPLFKMSEVQRSELYSFVALTFVRVPAYREFIDTQAAKMAQRFVQSCAMDREKFYAVVQAYEAETGQPLGDQEKLREFAASNNYSMTQRSAGYNLLLTFQSCIAVSEVLESEYRHDIYYAPADSFFMTCDNPVTTIEPDTDGTAWVGMGVGRPRTEILFPLNKRACMILRRSGRETQIRASSHRTRQINEMMMGVAQRCVYAPAGYRRLSRIFNERGFRIKYGENAFLAGQEHPP
jgi:hypothetical protein